MITNISSKKKEGRRKKQKIEVEENELMTIKQLFETQT